MAERVVLHIGTMKSGTTYLQGALGSGILEGHGAFYAGGSFGAQTAAVRNPTRWRRLAGEVVRSEGVAVYSQEFLSFTPAGRVPGLVGAFGGIPVDVVVTVRDQHRAIPAQWQSYTRNRGTASWPAYVRDLRHDLEGGPGPADGPEPESGQADDTGRQAGPARSFRRAQDVRRMVRRWRHVEGVAGVTIVLVPPSGSEPAALWRRFCEAAGLAVEPPTTAVQRSNESLGYASCDLLRRLNTRAGGLERRPYRDIRSGLLAALLPLRLHEGRPELARDGLLLANRLNERITRTIERSDVRLVGSADELRIVDPGDAPGVPAPPDEAEVRRAVAAVRDRCLPGATLPDRGSIDELVDELGRHLVAAARDGRLTVG